MCKYSRISRFMQAKFHVVRAHLINIFYRRTKQINILHKKSFYLTFQVFGPFKESFQARALRLSLPESVFGSISDLCVSVGRGSANAHCKWGGSANGANCQIVKRQNCPACRYLLLMSLRCQKIKVTQCAATMCSIQNECAGPGQGGRGRASHNGEFFIILFFFLMPYYIYLSL